MQTTTGRIWVACKTSEEKQEHRGNLYLKSKSKKRPFTDNDKKMLYPTELKACALVTGCKRTKQNNV